MSAATYKLLEIVGTSEKSIEDAINGAIQKCAQTVKHLDWFQVLETRGYIDKDKVKYYQVVLKIGFKIE